MPMNFLTDGQDVMRHAIGGNKAAARPVKTFSVGAVGAVTRLQSESTPISSSALYSVYSRPITQQRLKSRRGAVSSELSIYVAMIAQTERLDNTSQRKKNLNW
ncbi:hypothetical protein E4U30_007772 [Claviceps sp. LM220 group G6]|nr:hypothetical protein E4U30_007772 [Claviceps sp. LM220 group G6]